MAHQHPVAALGVSHGVGGRVGLPGGARGIARHRVGAERALHRHRHVVHARAHRARPGRNRRRGSAAPAKESRSRSSRHFNGTVTERRSADRLGNDAECSLSTAARIVGDGDEVISAGRQVLDHAGRDAGIRDLELVGIAARRRCRSGPGSRPGSPSGVPSSRCVGAAQLQRGAAEGSLLDRDRERRQVSQPACRRSRGS